MRSHATYPPPDSIKTSLNILKEAEEAEFDFSQGSYEIVDVVVTIQQILTYYSIPIEITYNSERKRVNLKLLRKNLPRKTDYVTLHFNRYLSKILGFSVTNSPNNITL